jgi:O-antigen ligase
MGELRVATSGVAEEAVSTIGRRARLEAAAGYWLCLLCGLFVLSAFLAPQSFAVLAAAGGLSMLPFVTPSHARAAGFVLLSLLCVWAVGPQLAAMGDGDVVQTYAQLERITGLKLVLMAVLFPALPMGAAALSVATQDRLAAILAWGLIGVAGLIVVDAVSGGTVFTFIATSAGSPPRPDLAPVKAAQGAYSVAVLAAPTGLWLWRRAPRALIVLPIAGLVAACVGLGADAPLAAGLAALVAFVGMTAWPRLGQWCLAVSGALYLFTAPWLVRLLPSDGASSGLPASWAHRERIWRFVSDRISERPIVGHGLDASRGFGDQVPLHPHNGALQIWLELGLLGAILATALWLWLVWRIGVMTDPFSRAAAAASLAAYAVIGALSFGVWQEWWLGLGAFAALCVTVGAPARACSS